ncbi:MAG: hypothetical protein JJT75_04795 [Opitutales bacterium]|nr:hypothetical protein [Opitutales bacterium]MCH8541536.1 hypothetical protein [Opitutales bacterium]
MKKSPISPSRLTALLAFMAIPVLFTGCGDASDAVGTEASASTDFDLHAVGLVPDSHFFLEVNLHDLWQSPFATTLQDAIKAEPEAGENFTIWKKEIAEKTGMDPEDFRSILISGNFAEVDIAEVMEAWDPFEKMTEQADFLWTLTFNKPISEEILELLSDPAAMELGEIDEKREFAHRDLPVTHLTFVNSGDPDMYYSLINNEQAFLFSTRESTLLASLDRFLDQSKNSQSEATTANLARLDGNQIKASFVLPENMKTILRQQISQTMEMDPMSGMFLKPMLEWEGMLFGVAVNEDMNALAVQDFSTESAASGFAGTLNMMIPMALMGMQSEGLDLGPNPMEHVRIEAVNNTVEIGFSITNEALVKMVEESYQSFQKAQTSSREAAMKNNLRMLGSASNQYFLEQGRLEVDVRELIGPGLYIHGIYPIANEVYGSGSGDNRTPGLAPNADGQFPVGEWTISEREHNYIYAEDRDTGKIIQYTF